MAAAERPQGCHRGHVACPRGTASGFAAGPRRKWGLLNGIPPARAEPPEGHVTTQSLVLTSSSTTVSKSVSLGPQETTGRHPPGGHWGSPRTETRRAQGNSRPNRLLNSVSKLTLGEGCFPAGG